MTAPDPRQSAATSHSNLGFEQAAWFYDGLSRLVFGKALLRAQAVVLDQLPPGALRLLVLGGGSGWVLTELLRRRPQAAVFYLEASPAMLQRARTRLRRYCPEAEAQVSFCLGTDELLPPQPAFDAVITFFVLDCLTGNEFAAALPRLYASLRPGGTWLVADFTPPRRWWQHALLAAMYWFFRLTTGLRARELPPYPRALASLGLHAYYHAESMAGGLTGLALRK